MANLFSSLQVYAGKWNVSDRRKFNDEEKKYIASNEVVTSEYGKSVCFTLVSGGKTFIPLSTNSVDKYAVGSSIDMDTAEVLTLSRQGEKDIIRVEC